MRALKNNLSFRLELFVTPTLIGSFQVFKERFAFYREQKKDYIEPFSFLQGWFWIPSHKKTKPPVPFGIGGFEKGSLTMSYFHWKYNQLSSALKRFTVLFGMGRSGTTSVWSSGKGFCVRALYAYIEFFAKKVKLTSALHSHSLQILIATGLCRLQAARL